ncbi:hypothetical protein Hanom_Chr09g00771101 [Helianthus anomalus]
MAMQFRGMGSIPKEERKVPRGVAWYENLMALPNRVFEVALYQSSFPTYAGLMDFWPLCAGEEPCRAITLAGKEVMYLYSEESVASSDHELNPPHDMFVGVLHNLGVDPVEGFEEEGNCCQTRDCEKDNS